MSVWAEYNPNPAGRNVGDCSVRAIAKALDTDWEDAYLQLVKAGYQMCDMPSSNSVIGALLRKNGFYRHTVPNTCPECYTAADFVIDHPHGVYVLFFGNHVATAVDGVVFDSWQSTAEIPQYYWSKEKDNGSV